MLPLYLSVLLLVAKCLTAPAIEGVSFDNRAGELPTLALPYATYRAASYNPNGDFYVFKNIRYAAPPLGQLRFAKPSPPVREPGIQNGSYGPICNQGTPLSFPGISAPPVSLKPTSEDCLFLDIYVPAKAIQNPALKLPVISWFYGGSYTSGSKDQFAPILPIYEGTGLLQVSSGNVIFVASNYRLGAFGFLAGTTMEREGTPNAGLYDQRAALQWIQNHIGLVGGDKTQVSAWGESAGAGSILHQLVAFGGKQDPLFSRAVLQSPGFTFAFDRKGLLERNFKTFANATGCAGQGVSCLRAANAEILQRANTQLLSGQGSENFTVGPSTDGNLIRQLPPLELASGSYTKIPTSFIFSHVSNEAEIFIPPDILTDSDFNTFVDQTFPLYAKDAGVNAAIEAHYPPVMSGSVPPKYATERDRVRDLQGEYLFYCNIRFLSDAYEGENYNLQYSVTPGIHAADLLPTFYNLNVNLTLFGELIPTSLILLFGSFAQGYQSYLTSHARSGDPNKYRKIPNIPPTINWPKPGTGGDVFTGVLDAGDLGFSLITDGKTTKSRCQFWRDVAAAVTNLGGYAPPGSVVPTNLVPVTGDPSRNYKT